MTGSRQKMPPGLVRKRLDRAAVEAHFEELAESAQDLEIRVKDGEGGHSQAAPTDLGDAARRLCAGEVVAVQIRFWKDGAWWCDTVMRRGDSYRLVRLQQS